MLKTAHSWRLEVPLQTNSPTKRRQVNHRRVRSDADMELATSKVRDASLGNKNFERPYSNYPYVISMSYNKVIILKPNEFPRVIFFDIKIIAHLNFETYPHRKNPKVQFAMIACITLTEGFEGSHPDPSTITSNA